MSVRINCKSVIHYFRYDGVLTLEELKKAMSDAHTNNPASNLIHDLREADIKHFDKESLIDLGNYIEELVKDNKRPPYKSAIVVADKLTYGIVRCATMYSSDIIVNSTRIYYDIDFAIDWLTGIRD